MSAEQVQKALEGLCKGLRSDGADLVVDSANEENIELSLILKENACLECIVPIDVLQSHVRIVLSKAFEKLPQIVLHDPRND